MRCKASILKWVIVFSYPLRLENWISHSITTDKFLPRRERENGLSTKYRLLVALCQNILAHDSEPDTEEGKEIELESGIHSVYAWLLLVARDRKTSN